MPSTVVHCALAGLLAAALLGPAFDRRAVAVVLLVTVVPDLDVFSGVVLPGTHRALLHTLLVPALVGGLVVYDTRLRERSWLLGRHGWWGVRVAWVAVLAYAFAGIGLDLFVGGANPLYPLHDQFYRFSGSIEYSTQRGWVQTFVEVAPPETASGGGAGGRGAPTVDAGQLGSTAEVHVSSGVDPSRGAEPADVDRVFPVVRSGWQLLLVLTSLVALAGRAVESRRPDRL
ncbi:metal-dependent hydrolase [Halomarina litorea]|uniref:metal-dependent hydrolase n=1 Tax=Halomarina litorea TaxID=2961595 RepID=UPI0020C37ADC|nr:metal-dependent hydrolase [Halomarina sp. BCD28]